MTLTDLSLQPPISPTQPPIIPTHCLSAASQQFLDRLDFTEPQTFHKAALHPGWQAAMAKELGALQETNTRDIVSLPPSKKPIACRWVYKVK